MSTTLITGNTYPVRKALADLGGAWDSKARGWHIPSEREAEARALVVPPTYAHAKVRRGRPGGAAGRTARATGPREWRPCGYPGCSREYCDECDGEGR